ncbi:hypothetical protein [Cobetia crustatorum]|uniref:hypothetical protein n=1 Tax=Cobetia crustatorum TaxID=553385 RepID=UPI0004ACA613|nr:hypothetical protein [Cobetia crustatorum]
MLKFSGYLNVISQLAQCRRWISSGLLGALLLSPVAMALEAPQGPIVLRVTGNIEHTNAGNEAHFDREMLKTLEQRETLTATLGMMVRFVSVVR